MQRVREKTQQGDLQGEQQKQPQRQHQGGGGGERERLRAREQIPSKAEATR